MEEGARMSILTQQEGGPPSSVRGHHRMTVMSIPPPGSQGSTYSTLIFIWSDKKSKYNFETA
jgi:hypothetical protein